MDVLIYHTVDNGDINIVNGTTELTANFDSAVYLSLFGGNEDDPGGADLTKTWWGNLTENEPEKIYRSKTQYILRSLPAVTTNLRKVQEAIKADLKWLLDVGAASSIDDINVSIPALNKIAISGSIKAEGNRSDFSFVENWESML